MLSAMTASIFSLRLVKIAPMSIHRWTDEKEGENGVEIKQGKDHNVGRQEMLEALRQRFESRMWENVTAGEATGGLELGTPSLEQVKKCQQWLTKRPRRPRKMCRVDCNTQRMEGGKASHGLNAADVQQMRQRTRDSQTQIL